MLPMKSKIDQQKQPLKDYSVAISVFQILVREAAAQRSCGCRPDRVL